MNILSANLVLGCIGILILFLISFLAVHTPSLLKKWDKNKDEPSTVQEEKKADPEPVYYIVEKKRKRVKETYSSPKEIHFK